MRDELRALLAGERRGLGAALGRGGLRLASVPYGWATALRNRLFDMKALPTVLSEPIQASSGIVKFDPVRAAR